MCTMVWIQISSSRVCMPVTITRSQILGWMRYLANKLRIYFTCLVVLLICAICVWNKYLLLEVHSFVVTEVNRFFQKTVWLLASIYLILCPSMLVNFHQIFIKMLFEKNMPLARDKTLIFIHVYKFKVHNCILFHSKLLC